MKIVAKVLLELEGQLGYSVDVGQRDDTFNKETEMVSGTVFGVVVVWGCLLTVVLFVVTHKHNTLDRQKGVLKDLCRELMKELKGACTENDRLEGVVEDYENLFNEVDEVLNGRECHDGCADEN